MALLPEKGLDYKDIPAAGKGRGNPLGTLPPLVADNAKKITLELGMRGLEIKYRAISGAKTKTCFLITLKGDVKQTLNKGLVYSRAANVTCEKQFVP